jgi:hypothetical protein
MAGDKITRPELITDDALTWGVEYAKNLEIANKATIDLIKASIKFNDTAKQFKGVTNEKEFNTLKKEQADLILKAAKSQEQLTKADKEALANLAKLEKAQRSANQTAASDIRLSETQRRQKEALAKSTERTRKAFDKENSAMAKLVSTRDRARRSVQELNALRVQGIKLSNVQQRELKQSEKEFRKLDKAVKKVKESTGQFQENVGNYPKLFGSAKNAFLGFVGAFGLFQGARLFKDFIIESKNLAIEAQGIEFAFQRIGFEGEDAFNRIKESTRGLLSDLDIKRSLVEFDNFNLSLKESDTLFEFLALRATQTGRSIDSLKDSLVEGLSKESKLRIDNLGISTAELNSELEKTESFIEAVANIAGREIAEAGDVLDKAASSQAKWNAQVEDTSLEFGKLIQAIQGGGGVVSDFFQSIVKLAGDAAKSIRELITPDDQLINEEALKNANDNIKTFRDQLENADKKLKGTKQTAKEFSKNIEETFKGFSGKQLQTEIEDTKKLLEETIKIGKETGTSEEDPFALKEKIKDLERELEVKRRTVEITKELLEEEGKPSGVKKKTAEEIAEEKRLAEIKRKNVFELNKFKLEKEIRLQEAIIKNEDNSKEKRLAAAGVRFDREKELTELIKDFNIQSKKDELDAVILEHEKAGEKIRDANVKKTKEEFDIRLDELKKFQKDTAAEENLQILQIQEEVLDSGGDENAREAANDKIRDIKIANAQKVFLKEKKLLEDLIALEGTTTQQKKDLSNKLKALEIANNELKLKDAKNKRDQEIEIFNEKFDTFKQIAEDVVSGISDIVNEIFERNIANIDAEIQANDEKFRRRFEAARGDKVQTELLQKEQEKSREKLENKKRKEQVKQAKFNKSIAIFEAVLNTAAAVTKALPNVVLAAIAGVLGAAQIALIASKPIPKFKEGTRDFKGGAAILGDGGRSEVVTDKNDRLLGITPSSDTLYNLPKGSNVYKSIDDFNNSYDRDKMVGATILASVENDYNKMSAKNLEASFDRNFDKLEKGIHKGIKDGFKKVKFGISNNITVDNSHNDYINSGLS